VHGEIDNKTHAYTHTQKEQEEKYILLYMLLDTRPGISSSLHGRGLHELKTNPNTRN
jgi:hypothetical protein